MADAELPACVRLSRIRLAHDYPIVADEVDDPVLVEDLQRLSTPPDVGGDEIDLRALDEDFVLFNQRSFIQDRLRLLKKAVAGLDGIGINDDDGVVIADRRSPFGPSKAVPFPTKT